MSSLEVQQKYIASLFEQGYTPESVKCDLLSMGWHPNSIKQAIDSQLDEIATSDPAVSAGPWARLDSMPTRIRIDDQDVQVQLRMHRPQICLLSNFLSAEECNELIEQSRPLMERSMVILGDGEVDDDGVLAYSRTSDQATFYPGTSELVDKIHRRVAEIAGWPEDKIECAQIVGYGIGADFEPHHDYFCPNVHAEIVAKSGQRVATVLLYLNTPVSGGATAFPDIELEIYPQQGNALFFAYPQPRADSLTLHAGVPLGCGEKWVATFFFRDRVIKKKEEAL